MAWKPLLAPVAGALEAAEFGDGRYGAIGVDPYDTGPHRPGDSQRAGAVAGEDAGGEGPCRVWLARLTTSSSLLNRSTLSTGPNSSVSTMRIDWRGQSTIVGS